MADELKEGAIGISATIDTSSNSKQADDFVKDIDRMEKSVDALSKTVDNSERHLKGINVTIGATGDEIKAAYQTMVAEMQKYNQAAAKGNTSTAAIDKAISDFNAKLQTLPKAIEEVNSRIAQLKEEQESLNSQLEDVEPGTEKYNELNKALQINSTALTSCRGLASNLTGAYDEVKTTVGDVGVTFEYLSSAVNTVTNATGSANMAQQINAGLKTGQAGATNAFTQELTKETQAHQQNTQALTDEAEATEKVSSANKEMSEDMRSAMGEISDLEQQIANIKEKLETAEDPALIQILSENLQTANNRLNEAKERLSEIQELEERESRELAVPPIDDTELRDFFEKLQNSYSVARQELKKGLIDKGTLNSIKQDVDDYALAIQQGAKNLEEADKIVEGIAEKRKEIQSQKQKEAEEKSASEKAARRAELEAKSVADLQARYQALQKEIARLSVQADNLYAEGKTDKADAKSALAGKKEKELEEIKEYLESIGESATANPTETIQKQMRALREEITQLTMQYRSLSDEEKNGDFGRNLQQQIDEATDKAGEMKDAINDVQQAMRAEAFDTPFLDATAQGLDTVISAVGGVIGVEGLWADEQEELIELQTKLQSVLTISNSIKTIQNNLQKESNLMVGIGNAQRAAQNAAISLNTALESKNVVVRWAAVAAQKALNLVCNANPYVLLIGAIATIVPLLLMWVKNSKKSKEAMEEEKKKAEELKQAQAELYDTLGKKAGETRASYEKLRREWTKLTSDKDKKKWVQDNADAFEQLGLNVNDVSSAENIFVTNTDSVVKALEARAKAAALQSLATKEWEDYYTKEIKNQTENKKYKSASKDALSTLTDAELKAAGIESFTSDQGITTYYTKKNGKTNYYTGSTSISETGRGAQIEEYRKAQANKKTAETTKKNEKELNDRINAINKLVDQEEANFKKNSKGLVNWETDNNKNKTNSTGKTQEQKDAEVRAEAAKYLDEQKKQAKEREKLEREIADRLLKEQIDRMEESSEKRMALQQYSFDQEQAQLDEQEEQAIEKEIARQKALFDIQEEQKKKKDDKYAKKTFGEDDIDTSAITGIREQYQALRESLFKNQQKEIIEIAKQREQSLNEYYKQYGTAEQKRLAITKLTEQKIAEAKDEGARLSAKKEGEEALKKVRVDAQMEGIKDDPSYVMAMTDPTTVATEGLTQLYTKLNNAKKALKDLPADQLQAIAQLINNIDEEMTSRDPFKKWKEGLQELADAKIDVSTAKEKLRKAQEELSNALSHDSVKEYQLEVSTATTAKENADKEVLAAQEAVDNADEEGDIDALEEARERLTVALNNQRIATDALASAQENLQAKEKGLETPAVAKARENVTNATNKLTNATNKQASADAKVKKAKDKTVQSLSKLSSAISEVGKAAGGEVGAVLDLIGGIGSTVMSAIQGMETASETASGAIKAVETASVILAVIAAAIQLAQQAADLLGLAKDDSQFEGAKANYEALNEIWDSLIEKKKKYLDISWGSEVKGTRKEIEALYQNKEAAARNMALEALGRGASVGSHSIAYRQNRDLGGYYRSVGIGDITDLARKSAEELEEIKENNVEFWAKLDGDFRGYLEDIIEGNEALKEFQEGVREKFAQISFDSMYDEFVDSLMDMDKTASDFADDISEKFARALLAQEIGEGYRKQLKDWYDRYTDDLEKNNGKLTEAQLDGYREEYMRLVQEAMEKRDEIASITGYNGSSSTAQATTSSAMSITEDTANDLVGRVTAGQIALERLNGISMQAVSLQTLIQSDVSKINERMETQNSYISEIVDIQHESAGYLYDIVKNTNRLEAIENHLARIESNTDKL